MTDELICGYCGQPYLESENHDKACSYHPQFYFPYDIDTEGNHQKGWQCCNNENSDAEGCVFSRHRSDVRRVYERLSIAFHYEVIDPDAERRAEEEREKRAQARKVWIRDPAIQAKVGRIKAFKDRTLEVLENLVGKPVITRNCYNGSSGFVYHSLANFYAWDGLFFQVDTPSLSSIEKVEYAERTVETLAFYTDRDEMTLANDELITDLS